MDEKDTTKYPIYCSLCQKRYLAHEVNSTECYQARIEHWKQLVETRGELECECKNCHTLTKVKFLRNTVGSSGCVHCIDASYVTDPYDIAEINRVNINNLT